MNFMMDGGLPQPKVTDIDGDNDKNESESDDEEKVKLMMDGGISEPKISISMATTWKVKVMMY